MRDAYGGARPEPRPRKRKTPYCPPRWSSRLYLRLDTRHIAVFKFLLEAHGHLGIMSVTDSHAAILKISYSPDQEPDMRAFLEEIRDAVPFSVIELNAAAKDSDATPEPAHGLSGDFR